MTHGNCKHCGNWLSRQDGSLCATCRHHGTAYCPIDPLLFRAGIDQRNPEHWERAAQFYQKRAADYAADGCFTLAHNSIDQANEYRQKIVGTPTPGSTT